MGKNKLYSEINSVNTTVDVFRVPYIAWEIKTQCNMGCQFCYSSSWNKVHWQKQNKIEDPSEESIVDGLKRLKASNIGIQYINWTGGEPLLRHQDLPNIFKKSRELGFKNILSTNCMFTPTFRNEENFENFLCEINDYLDFISISWDSDNKNVNNKLRIGLDGKRGSKYHYDDVKAFLKLFKEERYSFHLKVNTLVSLKNIGHIGGILQTLKDIPCLWKLVQFNPRECPNRYRKKYYIDRDAFFALYHEVTRKNCALPVPSKCFITSRLYYGSNEPYCFLVINTAGEVLLPKGEKHIPLVNIFTNSLNSTELKREIAKGIVKEIKATETYKSKAGEVNNKKSALELFTEANHDILYRSYLHSNFQQQEAIRKLNKLISIQRSMVADVPEWHSPELCDSIKKQQKQEDENEFYKLMSSDNEKAPSYNKLKFVLEQRKVSTFLREEWGIIGGTVVVLNPNEPNYRVVPCIDRAPKGVHFPWFFQSIKKKRDFFRNFFGGVVNGKNFDKLSEKINPVTLRRPLPKEILNKVLQRSIRKEFRSRIIKRINEYLSQEQLLPEDKADVITKAIIPIILTNCIEMISSQNPHGLQLNGGSDQKYAEAGKIDPLLEVFYNTKNRDAHLSYLEQKLNVMIVSAEESISSVVDWLSQTPFPELKKSQFSNIKAVWRELYEQQRVKSWKKYMENERNKLYVKDRSKPSRVVPIFWLYLFTPLLVRNNLFSIPHVLFFPFIGSKSQQRTKGTIRSFVAVYFDDASFKKFWQAKDKIWNDPKDIHEGNLKTYVHNIGNFVSSLSYYNINLELQSEMEKMARQSEFNFNIHNLGKPAIKIENTIGSLLALLEGNISKDQIETYAKSIQAYNQLNIAISTLEQIPDPRSLKRESEIKELNKSNFLLTFFGSNSSSQDMTIDKIRKMVAECPAELGIHFSPANIQFSLSCPDLEGKIFFITRKELQYIMFELILNAYKRAKSFVRVKLTALQSNFLQVDVSNDARDPGDLDKISNGNIKTDFRGLTFVYNICDQRGFEPRRPDNSKNFEFRFMIPTELANEGYNNR